MSNARSSIGRKLNRILALTTVIALLIAGAAIGALELRSRIHSIEDDLIAQADVLALSNLAALEFDDRRAAGENLSVLRAKPDVLVAAVYDARGQLFASYVSSAVELLPPPRAAPAPVQIDGEFVRVWRPIVSRSGRAGSLYLQAQHRLVPRAFEYAGILLVILGGSLAAALLIAHRMQRVITGPVLSMNAVARRVSAERNFDLRVSRTSDDEIGDLADTLNAMLDELGARSRSLESAVAALRASDERYQLVVRGSSAGLWDWDMATDTMFFAPRLRTLLGYSEQEFPDRADSLRGVMHDDDRPAIRAALDQHLADGLPFTVECRLRVKSGEWRWFQLTGMSERDAQGRAVRMAGSVIDVTERKRVEQALQESNRAKDEFIATLAHELRNPLAPLRTGLEILNRSGSVSPAAERVRQTMQRQLAHMVRLIDDLLDISRISSGKIHLSPSRVHLSDAVASAVEISRPIIDERGHRLEIELPPREIEMMADGTRVAQALGNLLHNAAKYTPEGGRIRLSARQEAAWAVIEIEDSGVGIPADMLEGVFSLFTQVGRTLHSAQGGLGIGLYLVRSLVELHGGSVVAASPGVGQGSTFTVRLPCLPQTAEAAPASDGAGPVLSHADLRVLVADDNVDAAETLATLLEMTGCTTRRVHDGNSVLPAAREFVPDLVLLDIGLPDIPGYEVARRLRGDPVVGGVHLVAVTGWGTEGDRRRTADAGFDEHLTKPVEFAAVESILLRARRRGEPGAARPA
ncbi:MULTISPECIES: ATP-binding protein [Ramlibacter]|uniref:histidine kinase n=1 Tax=Ramlibacter aquaticus TaxID=2780094 RepID=A0ABR9SF07_9BURK|nr:MULTISPECIES: ATP-binding protein [Ramlibacter]MBE7940876.1 PAS domain-containing protein [Ramlibacter aquaticus]